MYLYTDFDQQLINERVAQFRDQTERYLAGKLTEDEYRPLRLQNGLYVQRYAPMLRIAVPYGLMNSKQLRKVAELAKEYDRGYAHVSTRQNIQFNITIFTSDIIQLSFTILSSFRFNSLFNLD